MRCFRREATILLAVSFLLLTAPNAFAQEGVGLHAAAQAEADRVLILRRTPPLGCPETAAACTLSAGRRPSSVWLSVTAANTELTPEKAYSLNAVLTAQSQVYDLRGIPWIVAGGALVVGGIFVHGDAGTLLMFGGVVSSAYGLFIYF